MFVISKLRDKLCRHGGALSKNGCVTFKFAATETQSTSLQYVDTSYRKSSKVETIKRNRAHIVCASVAHQWMIVPWDVSKAVYFLYFLDLFLS